ncbi:nucleoside phosphorylase [Oscillibacter hominis]|uniref:Uridine phosphorylase n=1 Tax=Oscillibacter hominis TaxID=2763056 RepID=A0A7G9B2G9_9FIRM|nr:nucleoside phosphorylase [Oscillibacter hominis]QNL43750.1 nucleoside phosphorylase [Oscillibacter hominis]
MSNPVDKSAITGQNIRQYLTCLAPGDVGEYVLLPGDPARCDRTAKYLKDAKLVANNREHRTFTGTYKGLTVSVTSTGMGCPSAAIATEELCNAGAKVFIRIGSTAAIQEGIRVGDLIVSTGSMKNEGTSRFFVPDSFPAVPDFDLTALLLSTARELSETSVHYGIGSTDDSFYGETPEFIDRLVSYGCINLEMEASGVFTVAHRKGCRAAAIYGCSANLKTSELYYADGTPESGNQKLVDAWEQEIQIALETFYRFHQQRG